MNQHQDVGVGRQAPARGVPDVAPLGKEFSQVAEHLDSLVDGGVKSQHGRVLLREHVVQRYVGLDPRRAVVELDDRHLRRRDRLDVADSVHAFEAVGQRLDHQYRVDLGRDSIQL